MADTTLDGGGPGETVLDPVVLASLEDRVGELECNGLAQDADLAAIRQELAIIGAQLSEVTRYVQLLASTS